MLQWAVLALVSAGGGCLVPVPDRRIVLSDYFWGDWGEMNKKTE